MLFVHLYGYVFYRKNFVFTFAHSLCAILTDYLFGGVCLFWFDRLGAVGCLGLMDFGI